MARLTRKHTSWALILSAGVCGTGGLIGAIASHADDGLEWRAVDPSAPISRPAVAGTQSTQQLARSAAANAAGDRDGFDPRLIQPAAYRELDAHESFDPITGDHAERTPGGARTALHTDENDLTSVQQTAATASEDAARDAAVARGELIVERYPNRALKIERAVTQDQVGNFLNHGPWKMWSQSGELVVQGEFQRGRRQGAWSRWHYASPSSAKPTASPLGFSPADQPGFERPYVSRANFDNDQLNGAWIVTDSQGRKIAAWEFRRDQLSGLAVTWHATGLKARQFTIRDGVLDGDWTEWDAAGKVTAHKKYVAGRQIGPQTEAYPTGEPYAEGACLYAPQNVKAKYDFWNGVVDITLVRGDGQDEKHGKWTYWHQNGGKLSEGLFDHNLRVGEHVWWYPNGQVKARGEFVDGKQQGPWMWWHENGMKKSEGAFIAGVQHGTWMTWNDTGKVTKSRYSAQDEPASRAMYAQSDIEINPGQTGSAATFADVEEPDFARAGYETQEPAPAARRRDVRQVEHQQDRAAEVAKSRALESRTVDRERRAAEIQRERAAAHQQAAGDERLTADRQRRTAESERPATQRPAPRRQPTLREFAEENGMARQPERASEDQDKPAERRSVLNRITFGRFDKPEEDKE